MSFDFFRQSHELLEAGRPFATATVVRVEKPTSGTPGDKAIVTEEGTLLGWIGGSCARPTVTQEALAALRDSQPRLIRLSKQPDALVGREGITDLSMTCFSGGTMEIYIEPHLPKSRLLIVGDLPVAVALAALGEAAGFEVVTVEAYGEGALPGVERVADLKNLAESVHRSTYAVVATHGSYDEIALEKLLKARPAYIGLVASRKRARPIIDHVIRAGVDEEMLAVLKVPAGLDLGGRAPEEVAISVLAEIVERRHAGAAVVDSATTSGEIVEVADASGPGRESDADESARAKS